MLCHDSEETLIHKILEPFESHVLKCLRKAWLSLANNSHNVFCFHKQNETYANIYFIKIFLTFPQNLWIKTTTDLFYYAKAHNCFCTTMSYLETFQFCSYFQSDGEILLSKLPNLSFNNSQCFSTSKLKLIYNLISHLLFKKLQEFDPGEVAFTSPFLK